jgi:uncharacterized membrane protein
MLVRDSRWSSARVAVDATLLGLAVALAGLGRGWSELDRGRVSTWLLVAGLAVGLLALAALRLAMRRRPVRLPETQVADAA